MEWGTAAAQILRVPSAEAHSVLGALDDDNACGIAMKMAAEANVTSRCPCVNSPV